MNQSTATVYSCSGCSNVAQLANKIAVTLDRNQQVKMSCIAGVGAGVPSLVNFAKNSQKIFVIDGCPMACAKRCLENQNIPITKHVTLTDYEIKKIDGIDVPDEEFNRIFSEIIKIFFSFLPT